LLKNGNYFDTIVGLRFDFDLALGDEDNVLALVTNTYEFNILIVLLFDHMELHLVKNQFN
jgi:hypothetical protein